MWSRFDTLEARIEILQIEHQDKASGLGFAQYGWRRWLCQIQTLHQSEYANEIVICS